MRWLNPYIKFFEQTQFQPQAQIEIKTPPKYNSKNLVSELCVGMLLLNGNFLDDLLDRGMKARYSGNSQVFIGDLKSMLLNKNRLKIGKFVGDTCVENETTGTITNLFDNINFELEQDWNTLIDARILCRNICDKILQDDKLTSEMIKCIYWVGLEENKTCPEDIVIELTDGKQYGLAFNKSMGSSKSTSFNTFGDQVLGVEMDNLYKGEYQSKWDKLVQDWVKIIFENANKNIQVHIEKFIEPDRIDSLTYFEYFNIKHRDIRFKNIGENIKEFDKNILYLSDLLQEIWKHKENCFMDPQRVYEEWVEKKIFLMNSKILEHIFTESILKNYPSQIKKDTDGFKVAEGDLKMRFLKIIVEKLGALERPIYFFSNKGNTMDFIPSRELFRKLYDDFVLKFDYHVKMMINTTDENSNDFRIKMTLEVDEYKLFDLTISIDFTGGEMSNKMTSKFKFEKADDFNLVLTKKMNEVED
jgi:hypothetical protein